MLQGVAGLQPCQPLSNLNRQPAAAAGATLLVACVGLPSSLQGNPYLCMTHPLPSAPSKCCLVRSRPSVQQAPAVRQAEEHCILGVRSKHQRVGAGHLL